MNNFHVVHTRRIAIESSNAICADDRYYLNLKVKPAFTKNGTPGVK